MKQINKIMAGTCIALLCMAGTQQVQAQKVYKTAEGVVLDCGPGTGFPQKCVETIKGKKVLSGSVVNDALASSTNQTNGTINSTVYKKLIVGNADEECGGVSWAGAYNYCKTTKGGGWRLPTQREFILLCLFRTALVDLGVTSFVTSDAGLCVYWTATEIDTGKAEAMHTAYLSPETGNKINSRLVRCVREID